MPVQGSGLPPPVGIFFHEIKGLNEYTVLTWNSLLDVTIEHTNNNGGGQGLFSITAVIAAHQYV